MSFWTETVLGLYCERLDASFWAEPVNALSNGAFLVAAALAARRWRRDGPALALAGLVAAIGVGSFLFHTVATRWALMADVLPIQLFVALYFFLILRRAWGVAAVPAIAGAVAFVAVAAAVPQLAPTGTLRGSVGYAGALLGLVGMGASLALSGDARRRQAGSGLLGAAATFAVSLTARTLDGAACAYSPVGAHPLWHILNALVLFILIDTFGRSRPPKVAGDH